MQRFAYVYGGKCIKNKKGVVKLLQNMTLSNFLINKFCCLNKKCLDYGKKGVGNIVVHSRYGKSGEIRMLKCKTCGSYFSERRNTALYNCKLQKNKAFEILYQLSKGYSIRKIHRLTRVSRDAISRLAHIDREHVNSLLDYLIRYLKVTEAMFDDEQSSVEKK